jgi:hypothetical protein
LIELATRGLPVVGLATDQFDRFSRQVLQQRNAADLRIAVIAHPLGGISASAAQDRITPQVFDAVVGALTESDAPVTASL